MADFDNGIPPEGTDISDDHIGSVAYDSTADNTEDSSHIGSVAFASAEDNPEDTSHIGSVAYDAVESGDNPFTIQVLCDEEWEVAEFPEWVLPDIRSGNGNGTIDFIVYKNTGHERTGKIVVQTLDGIAKAEHTITQEAGGTIYIASINMSLAASESFTAGQLLLENVQVNRNDSEMIDQIGPFNLQAGQSIAQAISYSSLEAKPDAITCTVWVADIDPVPANRQVNILSGDTLIGTILTDADGTGSMEMTMPITNTDLDNYIMNIEAVAIDDYVTLDSTSHLSSGYGDTFDIRVTSNAHWSIADLPAWAHADITSGGEQGDTVTVVHITVDANSGGARNAFFSFITDSDTATATFQLLQDVQ